MQRIKTVILIFFMIFHFSFSNAAKYYVAMNGNDLHPGSSEKSWATFSHAFSIMNSGDTLIIKDGVYDEPIRSYYGDGFPPGSPTAYTVIKAENDWQVRVTGRLRISGTNTGYIHIQGIHFTVNTDGMSGHHLKFIRCSFRGDICDDNTTVVGVGTGSSYVLFEECFAYGCGRYKFMAYGDQDILTEKIIFRRCVSRHDYHDPTSNWGQQCATFTSYDCHDFMMQNCISINSGDDDPYLYGNLYGGIWFENKETTPGDNSARIQGCIFLNLGGLGAISDPKNNGTRLIENSIIWDSKGGYGGGRVSGNPTLLLNHMTIGNIWGVCQDESYAWGSGACADNGFVSEQIRNSIITDCNSYGIVNYMTSDYNDYFNNAEDFGHTWGVPAPVAGYSDRFVNHGLKYICRVEDDSPLKGAASDGGNIGATVIKRYGVSGTLWGEPGYDSLINEPLWPFPNEDIIKSEMRTWNYVNDGTRGFCDDSNGLYGGPVTLTSYIWEYLGYPCPPEIYGTTGIHGNSNSNIPSDFILSQNYPNPFNPNTVISYKLKVRSEVVLMIYDILGREIAILVNEVKNAGDYTVEWNGTNSAGKLVGTGVYFYQLKTGNSFVAAKKMMLLK
ncbi:MAG: T9SS type A sorting domain-containing protein [Bacteroidetes bacterium]|nr:T9SS type A sorting domain-containing protein [Bacteroidota bacterium]